MPSNLTNEANALLERGDRPAARRLLEQDLASNPDDVHALHLLSTLDIEDGKYGPAAAKIIRVLESDPANAGATYNLGLCYLNTGDRLRALGLFRKAVELEPANSGALYNVAYVLRWMGRIDEAAETFASVVKLNPGWVSARLAYCDTLLMQNRHAEVLAECGVLVRQGKADPNTFRLRGDALRRMGNLTDAESEYLKALQLNASDPDALHNLGGTLQLMGRSGEAIRIYTREVVVAGQDSRYSDRFDGALGELIRVCRGQCDWSRLEVYQEQALKRVRDENGTIDPSLALMIWDDPKAHRACARNSWPNAPRETKGSRARATTAGSKLRVGYIWGDFREAATGRFLAGVVEAHDRNRFELFGYNVGSSGQQRLAAGVDNFRDTSQVSDEKIATVIASDQLDLLFDLTGRAVEPRPGVLLYRPAPVLAHYFPGTIGTKAVDYIIADRHVIRPEEDALFDEAVIRLPDIYQASDSTRPSTKNTNARAQSELSQDAFVFCAFMQTVRLSPALFDVYMNILKEVSNSQLWLLEVEFSVRSNLRKEAAARGIDADRLVFAAKPSFEEHVERYQLADLFLDSWPHSGHTTTSDALWAGLPVLTRTGNSFASRIGASLLAAAGLPELIASDAESFQRLAVRLASEPSLLASYRKRIEENRGRNALFDTPRFTAYLERAFEWMIDRNRRGLGPESYSVPPSA